MRPVLFFLLMVAATPSLAEFLKVAETDKATYYLDANSLRAQGHRRKVWEIQNLKQRLPDGQMSRRELQEYDCRRERVRSISLIAYSEPMAGGQTLVWRSVPADWVFIPYKTPHESVLRFVCSA